jgi:hypothetical protein
MSVWGICAWLFFINKSMRFFIVITMAFGIGFFLYGYVNSHWITDLNPEGMLIILNGVSWFAYRLFCQASITRR